MKRVTIKTAGKVLMWEGFQVRTPTTIDVTERNLKGFKSFLKIHGVNKYEITDIKDDEAEYPHEGKVDGIHSIEGINKYKKIKLGMS